MEAQVYHTHPPIIQGGMGVGISDWSLARAVSLRGQLGVVSGSVLDTVFVRRLQDGDPGGHMRRALDQLPLPGVAEDILRRFFVEGGRPDGAPYRLAPMYRQRVKAWRQQLTVAANFCEVWLAREGHDGPVGLNLLTKVQLPNLASLYGAMLAGVHYVLMGAGIPREIPGILDRLAQHLPVRMSLDVEGASRDETHEVAFDPADIGGGGLPTLDRPFFFPIIASNSLATMMARKASGRVDGFVIEGPTAGGHNAPPRGALTLNDRGEPIYGPRDEVDLDKIRELGLPFWLAGGTGTPEALAAARDAGAAGIQVGTIFAYCLESGLDARFRDSVLYGDPELIDVLTDRRASPTGFPFKAVQMEGTLSSDAVYERRERNCDLGYLRTAYRKADGSVDYRCPAEPVDQYVAKGGAIEDTVGRKCLCNSLLANIGQAQVRAGGALEPALITSGDDLARATRLAAQRGGYSAGDVIDYLLSASGEHATA
jgi:nitronate monooxygenase